MLQGVGFLLECFCAPGKLMRYLVDDAAHVNAEQPCAEVEVSGPGPVVGLGL